MKYQTFELTIESIITRVESKRIDFRLDFHRGEVWKNKKRKRFIDSILRGWCIPPLHLVKGENGTDEVLDGHQRLSSIYAFFNNEFPIDGFVQPYDDKMIELDGLYYKDLSKSYQKKFLEYNVTIVRLTDFEPEEPAELFYRLNQPSSLTSAEQVNTCVGITRDQIKDLANLFVAHGITEDLIGLSNSRLSYDEVISKFCFAVELKTLKKKITATDIANHYRNQVAFSDECIEIARETIDKFLICIKDLNDSKFYFNKASLYSWLVFTRQNLMLDNSTLKALILNFEFCRSCIKGKLGIYKEECVSIYLQLKEKIPFFEQLLTSFNKCASIGNVNVSAIVYRDIAINIFKDFFLNVESDLLSFYISESENKTSMDEVLEAINQKYGWGETYK